MTKPQQRLGRAGAGLVFGRDRKEHFGSVAIALALEHAFAQPVLRIRDRAVTGEAAQEVAKTVFSQRFFARRAERKTLAKKNISLLDSALLALQRF